MTGFVLDRRGRLRDEVNPEGAAGDEPTLGGEVNFRPGESAILFCGPSRLPGIDLAALVSLLADPQFKSEDPSLDIAQSLRHHARRLRDERNWAPDLATVVLRAPAA
jgi:hypothetical protein